MRHGIGSSLIHFSSNILVKDLMKKAWEDSKTIEREGEEL